MADKPVEGILLKKGALEHQKTERGAVESLAFSIGVSDIANEDNTLETNCIAFGKYAHEVNQYSVGEPISVAVRMHIAMEKGAGGEIIPKEHDLVRRVAPRGWSLQDQLDRVMNQFVQEGRPLDEGISESKYIPEPAKTKDIGRVQEKETQLTQEQNKED